MLRYIPFWEWPFLGLVLLAAIVGIIKLLTNTPDELLNIVIDILCIGFLIAYVVRTLIQARNRQRSKKGDGNVSQS